MSSRWLLIKACLTAPSGICLCALCDRACVLHLAANFAHPTFLHPCQHAQIYNERRQIAAQLQDALAEQLSALQTSDVMSSTSLAKDTTATAMERLHRNVLKERCLMMLTGEVAFASLDAPQIARLGLACYPHRPDEVALWNEIARQQQR